VSQHPLQARKVMCGGLDVREEQQRRQLEGVSRRLKKLVAPGGEKPRFSRQRRRVLLKESGERRPEREG